MWNTKHGIMSIINYFGGRKRKKVGLLPIIFSISLFLSYLFFPLLFSSSFSSRISEKSDLKHLRHTGLIYGGTTTFPIPLPYLKSTRKKLFKSLKYLSGTSKQSFGKGRGALLTLNQQRTPNFSTQLEAPKLTFLSYFLCCVIPAVII